jgi:hypothetical protein
VFQFLDLEEHQRVDKALTSCLVYEKLFKFFELQIPAVLSASFYEPQPPSLHKLAVLSWFATRSCLLEVKMPLIDDFIVYKQLKGNFVTWEKVKDRYVVASSTFAADQWKCCHFCTTLADLMPAYCTQLQACENVLTGWLAPKELNQDDQIKSALEFIDNPEVVRQFSVNFTFRQQWLAIALAALLKVWQN